MMIRQYSIELFDHDKTEESKYRGIIMGADITDTVRKLEEYYVARNITVSSLELTEIFNEGDAPEGLIETEFET